MEGVRVLKLVKSARLLGAALVLVAVLLPASSAFAASGQLGQQQVTLNPGGGVLANGTDGIRFTINSSGGTAGQDWVNYRNTPQYCCGAGAPMLNVGGTLYGQAGPGTGATNWTSLAIISTSGAVASGSLTSTTGNASATVRYTATKSGRNYIVDRTVSYTYPNDYITDSYTFTIPSGNTDAVKFYLGGDTAPGGSDSGYGVMLTAPVRSVISLNTSSRIMFGFREVSGSKAFDGATSQSFSAPYATVASGGNIGFVGTASVHDAGLMMQWDLGSDPGTQTASFEQFATQQGTNLNAVLGSTSSDAGTPVQLNFSIVNTELTTVNSLGFTATLPSGLVVASGSQTNSCGGTVTATAGSSAVVLSGGSVGATTNCVMSVPVVANTAGTYTISASSISGLSSLTNNVGTSAFTVAPAADNDGDGISNVVEDAAPNSGDANNDGTADKNQLNVTSFVSTLTSDYVTVVADNACDLTNTSIKSETALATDDSYSYPLGLLDFTADCGTPGYTTTIKQYFYNPPADTFVLRKFVNGSYQSVSGATIVKTTIGGQQVMIATYQVTDGGVLDDDGSANGVIVDPAGPAVLGASVAAPATGMARINTWVFVSSMLVGVGLLAGCVIGLKRSYDTTQTT